MMDEDDDGWGMNESWEQEGDPKVEAGGTFVKDLCCR
jgi:hypothetical protein